MYSVSLLLLVLSVQTNELFSNKDRWCDVSYTTNLFFSKSNIFCVLMYIHLYHIMFLILFFSTCLNKNIQKIKMILT